MSDTEDERDFYQKCYEEKIDECERLQKQLEIACNTLYLYAECPTPNPARTALDRIEELGGDYSHYLEQQLKDLELNK